MAINKSSDIGRQPSDSSALRSRARDAVATRSRRSIGRIADEWHPRANRLPRRAERRQPSDSSVLRSRDRNAVATIDCGEESEGLRGPAQLGFLSRLISPLPGIGQSRSFHAVLNTLGRKRSMAPSDGMSAVSFLTMSSGRIPSASALKLVRIRWRSTGAATDCTSSILTYGRP